MTCTGLAVVSRHQAGFTLLELLVVVFILSTLAFTATSFVDNQDDQQRLLDTQHRLEAIRAAVLGLASAVPAGFVADNGVLPVDLVSLINTAPAGYAAQGLLTPVFDGNPDSGSGHNDGGAEQTLPAALAQPKGWRAGTLLTPPNAAGAFGDGWRAAGGAPNFNWLVASSATGFAATSQGKDGVAGGAEYNADVGITVNPADWGQLISGYTVRLRNQSGADINQRLRVSLLVFENTASGGKWKRYSSDALLCLDGTGDNLVASLPCAAEDSLTFPAGGYPGGTYGATRIPAGRHILVVAADADVVAHNGASEMLYPSAATPASVPVICTAAGCSPMTLVIR